MKYREAKLLTHGDIVLRTEDNAELFVDSVEVYGQLKRVRLNCIDRHTFKNVIVYMEDVNHI